MTARDRGSIETRVFQAIERAANAGLPCPDNETLSAITGGSVSGPVRVMQALEQRGLIVVGRFACGREVTIVATGRKTLHTGSRSPHFSVRRRAAAEQIPKIPAADPVAAIAAAVTGEAEAKGRRRAQARQLGYTRSGPIDAEAEPLAAPADLGPPCPLCGVRADVGCEHSARRAARAASQAEGRSATPPPKPVGRPRTFEEQLTAVAAGARIVEVQPLKYRPDPDRTLGGVGSAML